MRTIAPAVVGILLIAGSAQATDLSLTLQDGVAALVMPQAQSGQRVYEIVQRAGPSGSTATLWCSRYDPSPAAFKAGSFNIPVALAAGWSFRSPNYVPQTPLWCIANGGPIALTVEVAP